MSTITLPQSTNGTKPHAAPVLLNLLALAAKVDRLAELRSRLKALEADERALTKDILGALESQGLRVLHGVQAVAAVEVRTALKVDAELFHGALGARAYTALSVSLTAARRLMGEEDLAAIGETTTSQALRVEALAGKAVA